MEKKTKACPFCWEEILVVAKKCRYCWEFLDKKEVKEDEVKEKKEWKFKWCAKWILFIFLGLVVILIISALFSDSGTPKRTYTLPTTTNTTSSSSWNPTENKVSKEYENALYKANQYSELMHMSKTGIYNQLTSEYGEWFSVDAVKYAINNLKADYKKNALEKAKEYQDMTHMSRNEIYKQLISEHWEWFTAEEAQYAIDNL